MRTEAALWKMGKELVKWKQENKPEYEDALEVNAKLDMVAWMLEISTKNLVSLSEESLKYDPKQ
jgi:hypothetical protein